MPQLPVGGGREGHAGFPLTRHSLIAGAASASPEVRRHALETIAAAYWKPVYTYLRLRWRLSDEDAQDLTQTFFARAVERDFFARFDPTRARLRTWLRLALDGIVANERKASGRLKRGGGAQVLPFDFHEVERELAGRADPGALDPEDLFHREWVRSLFEGALRRLGIHAGERDKEVAVRLFVSYDVEGAESDRRPTYSELAVAFGVPVTQVTNHLAWARREFRGLVLEALREATATDEEFRAEAQDLLGGERA